jgi:hypothetical protein
VKGRDTHNVLLFCKENLFYGNVSMCLSSYKFEQFEEICYEQRAIARILCLCTFQFPAVIKTKMATVQSFKRKQHDVMCMYVQSSIA